MTNTAYRKDKKEMISVQEAQIKIRLYTPLMSSVRLQLNEAVGFVLSENILSPVDSPPFDQSAMDGYAVKLAGNQLNMKRIIIGEVQAGIFPQMKIRNGEAVRIFTGAPVPAGADAVVMQEKVERVNNEIKISENIIPVGANIRLKGSQVRKGNPALKAGTKLNAGAIGFLASLGITSVNVFQKPAVAIIVTGKELVAPGGKLKAGQIYESNSATLSAALNESGIIPVSVLVTDDDVAEITAAIRQALKQSDILLISGGISVGDYDFVSEALQHCKVKKIFYGVKQKPGKPLWFGKRKSKTVFALPGNPSAALTCFYEYVAPCISKMSGMIFYGKQVQSKKMSADYLKKPGLTYFLKGKISGDKVIPLTGQESYMLNSFAEADCLVYLEENIASYKKGDAVKVHLLPS